MVFLYDVRWSSHFCVLFIYFYVFNQLFQHYWFLNHFPASLFKFQFIPSNWQWLLCHFSCFHVDKSWFGDLLFQRALMGSYVLIGVDKDKLKISVFLFWFLFNFILLLILLFFFIFIFLCFLWLLKNLFWDFSFLHF